MLTLRGRRVSIGDWEKNAEKLRGKPVTCSSPEAKGNKYWRTKLISIKLTLLRGWII